MSSVFWAMLAVRLGGRARATPGSPAPPRAPRAPRRRRGAGHPGHQPPHQRLRHARVDVVHGDVVAGEGAEAQGQLGEVARADHEPALLVGEVHEDLGALAGLEVLVGDGLRSSGSRPMSWMCCAHAARMSISRSSTPGRPRPGAARCRGCAGGAEARHGHGQDARSARGPAGRRCARRRAGPGSSRGLPRGPSTTRGRPRVLEALGEPRGLDGEDLAAALVQGGGVVRARTGADPPHAPARWGSGGGIGRARRGDSAGAARRRRRRTRSGASARREPLRVDVGDHELALAPEALALREEHAVLGHQQVAPEHDVGGRLVDAQLA